MDTFNQDMTKIPFPKWTIYATTLIFGPIGGGLACYKSLKNIGGDNTGRLMIKTSIIFSIVMAIFGILNIEGTKFIFTLGIIGFAGFLGNTHEKYVNIWQQENPNNNCGNTMKAILWGICGGIIYLLPLMMYIGYQYLYPCPTDYIVIGDMCIPAETFNTHIRNLKN